MHDQCYNVIGQSLLIFLLFLRPSKQNVLGCCDILHKGVVIFRVKQVLILEYTKEVWADCEIAKGVYVSHPLFYVCPKYLIYYDRAALLACKDTRCSK